MMHVLRLSLSTTSKGTSNVIVCICRGKSDRDVRKAIDHGAESVRDLQRCGIGTDCGSCHSSLRTMLAAASAEAAQPSPACTGTDLVTAVATA
jgi:bacterioferritin-associated ferredoxin